MKLQRLMSLTRKAIDDYQMIEEGDKIAVGISGGKDSLALLYSLAGLRRFYPKKFTLEAITIDLGFEGFDLTAIKELCETLDVPYTIVKTEIGEIIFKDRKETNPCSLCAKISSRYQIEFDASIDNLITATDFAKYIFKPLKPNYKIKDTPYGCPFSLIYSYQSTTFTLNNI